jgi:NAD(P)-dependent dehydrogenase (short-subunit alcohol dehydrogenase family)
MSNPTTHRPPDGRVALMTRAASGIGQAVAVGIAGRQATVIALERD